MIQDNMKIISIVLSPLKNKIRSNRKFVDTLLHIFEGVTDFRKTGMIKYDLDKILCICLLLAMRGKFTSFYHAAMFIKVRADYFRQLGLIEGNNIPSHDTLRRIFIKIDANELLIDRVPEELWTEVRDIVQETGIKTIPMEKKCKKAKWLSEEVLSAGVPGRRE